MDRNMAFCVDCQKSTVALRKESVDRNGDNRRSRLALDGSLSARRAWIEINGVLLASGSSSGRSPQGERG